MNTIRVGMRRTKRVLCFNHIALMLSSIEVIKYEPDIGLVYFKKSCLVCEMQAHDLRLNPPEPNVMVLPEKDFITLLNT